MQFFANVSQVFSPSGMMSHEHGDTATWVRRGPAGFRSQASLEDLSLEASSAKRPSTWLACSRVSADDLGFGLCARRALTFRTGITHVIGCLFTCATCTQCGKCFHADASELGPEAKVCCGTGPQGCLEVCMCRASLQSAGRSEISWGTSRTYKRVCGASERIDLQDCLVNAL